MIIEYKIITEPYDDYHNDEEMLNDMVGQGYELVCVVPCKSFSGLDKFRWVFKAEE